MKKTKLAAKYDFKSIERKWQKKWEKEGVYRPDLDKAKKPFYNLMMFPYPSAEGLHVGNMYAFTGADVFGRFKQLQGYDVFEPIGLDGFGIHSENYAMKIGEHIKDVSARSEKNFYRQLCEIGNMYDWSRTVETYKPEYYRWTQWLFLQMFKKNLAYQKQAKVNWCPSCKTVLSDEQVISGECERCDSEVEKKQLKQWFFAITRYADQLLKNLDWIDWPDDVKTNQRNWIGRSEGAIINFKVVSSPFGKGGVRGISSLTKEDHKILPSPPFSKEGTSIKCFTTRPDTLFGATYMVVAPEHELLDEAKSQIKNQKEVFGYIAKALRKTEQQRKNEEKAKTGVEIKGIRAVNPATGKEIPIWVADYVLAGYGTGAIMAVPAHDQRDWEFAKKFNLPIEHVVTQYIFDAGTDKPKKNKPLVKRNAITAIIKHWDKNEFLLLKYNQTHWKAFVMGGIKKGEDLVDTAKREILEETGFKNAKFVKKVGGPIHAEFFHAIKGVNRLVRNNCMYFELQNGQRAKRAQKEKDIHDFEWVPKKKVEEALNIKGHKILWERLQSGDDCFVGEGISIGSGFLDGLKTQEAKKEMITWLAKTKNGKKSVDYKLRDWCISRQRYWGPPIPIVWCKHCALKNPPSLPSKKGGETNHPPLKRGKEGVLKVLLIHGFEGHGDNNWFPWMKKQLEKVGCEVFAPTMKTANHPTVHSWTKQLQSYLKKLDENSIIIGHSLGSKAAMHLLNSGGKKVSRVFLIGSALGTKKRNWDWFKKEWKNSDVDSLKKFWEKKVDWKDAEKKIGKVHVIASNDDPYISPQHKRDIEIKNKEIEIWDKQGHFQQKQNPKLRDYIVENILQGVEPVAIPVPEKDLPVSLPPMEDFLPEGKGKGPLAKNEKFVKTKCPVCGGPAERETDVSDPFLDSAWYFFRYPSTEIGDKVFDKKRTKKWLPVDSYIGGKEHTVLHLLYSRFMTMVLKDLGHIDFDEPYKRFFGHGLITKDGAKMSKSKGNVVNPDDMIKKFGADTVRLYLRFVGDFAQGGDWRDSGIEGMHKFVKRTWTVFRELEGSGPGVESDSMIDKTIKVVGEDIEKLSFNTAVARIMEFVNWLRENKKKFNKDQSLRAKKTLAFVLAPMAPHIAEEFWSSLKNPHNPPSKRGKSKNIPLEKGRVERTSSARGFSKDSIFDEKWPQFDAKNIVDQQIELVVQVAGKVRDKLVVSKDITENEATALALESEKVQKHLAGKKPKKVIYVKGRLVSVVV